VAQTLPCMSATALYCCALRTHSAWHPVDSALVNTRRARQRGDDWGADIKGDVCATRGWRKHKRSATADMRHPRTSR
jgi:hypothetical protein